MKKVFFFAFIAIAAFSLSSFTKTSNVAAKAYVATENFSYYDKIPIEGTYQNPCTGEEIEYSGFIHLNNHGQVKDGVVSQTSKSNTQGVSGVGLTSGLKYQFIQQGKSSETTSVDGCVVTTTQAFNFKIVSQSSADNYTETVKFVYTYNYCTGEFNFVSEEYTQECK